MTSSCAKTFRVRVALKVVAHGIRRHRSRRPYRRDGVGAEPLWGEDAERKLGREEGDRHREVEEAKEVMDLYTASDLWVERGEQVLLPVNSYG